eukprot:gene17476-23781_t
MSDALQRVQTSWPGSSDLASVIFWADDGGVASEPSAPIHLERPSGCGTECPLDLDFEAVSQAISTIEVVSTSKTVEVSVQHEGETSLSYATSVRGSKHNDQGTCFIARVDVQSVAGWKCLRLRLLSLKPPGTCTISSIQLLPNTMAQPYPAEGASTSETDQVSSALETSPVSASQMSQMKLVLQGAMQSDSKFSSTIAGAIAKQALGQQGSLGTAPSAKADPSFCLDKFLSPASESTSNATASQPTSSGMSLSSMDALCSLAAALGSNQLKPINRCASPSLPVSGGGRQTETTGGVEALLGRIESRLASIETRLGSMEGLSSRGNTTLEEVLRRLEAVENRMEVFERPHPAAGEV